MIEKRSVEDYLNSVDYSAEEDYVPRDASLNFINFIKLVNGDAGEENKTPVVHFKLMDNIFSKQKRLAILCHRGFAKSTLMEYLFLYIAVFGKLDSFGSVTYALFVGDSAENGCRNLRKNMENRFNNSDFLQHYLPYSRFTDTMIEYRNLDGKSFAIKLVGAQQSLRGTRYLNTRPEICVIDDVLTDLDAKSPTCIANIENTIYKAVDKALHPKRNKIVYIGTIFSSFDPLYKAVESGVWSPSVYPVCETFPCSKEDFKGSWEDRFSYEVIKEMYDTAVAMGKLSDFNSEMMNRIMSDEDRLIQDCDISWYKRKTVIDNKGLFNFYITTDFATSEKTSADFSVISVWAYNSNGDWLWVDGICKRQLMDANVNDLFRLAQIYNPQGVGVEITGQQGGFIQWIQNEMLVRNNYFTLTSEGNNNRPGIRPNTNKMQRFNVVVPLFKMNKIYLPEERKTSSEVVEMVNELSLASAAGFKSKHDDVIDTISMLSVMGAYKPSETIAMKKEENTELWDWDIEPESHKLESYIV